MASSKAKLIEKIDNRSARVCVIGMGYVGLPLAVEACKAGYIVDGYDVSKKKIDILNSGGSDVDDIPAEVVAELVESGKLHNTTDPSIIEKADIITICVPTPLNKTKDPDVSYILDACGKIAEYMTPGTFAVLESTTYPGTTEELILPKLEESGLKVGEDFFLAFSPERVDPGNPIYQTHNTPKVVGGITDACNEVAKAFYETTIEHVVMVSSTKAAEMVKLLENTFRSVNIGLVNEVALMCDRLGINVWEIIDAAATKPFGFMAFYPGPGLGGHCIPIDPHYLSWKLKSLNYYARFIELAGEINGNMPAYVVSQAADILNQVSKPIKGSKIVLLGMAYKKDISDVRESPALDLLQLFQEKGAEVVYNDPYVKTIKWGDGELNSVSISDELLANADLIVISTDHKVYDWDNVVAKSKLILDTRNSLKEYDEDKIYKLGGGRFPASVGLMPH